MSKYTNYISNTKNSKISFETDLTKSEMSRLYSVVGDNCFKLKNKKDSDIDSESKKITVIILDTHTLAEAAELGLKDEYSVDEELGLED